MICMILCITNYNHSLTDVGDPSRNRLTSVTLRFVADGKNLKSAQVFQRLGWLPGGPPRKKNEWQFSLGFRGFFFVVLRSVDSFFSEMILCEGLKEQRSDTFCLRIFAICGKEQRLYSSSSPFTVYIFVSFCSIPKKKKKNCLVPTPSDPTAFWSSPYIVLHLSMNPKQNFHSAECCRKINVGPILVIPTRDRFQCTCFQNKLPNMSLKRVA